MFRWLVVAFVVVPLTELYLLVWLSGAIGFWETVAIALVTGIVGGNLARREGLRVWRSWKLALEGGQAPESGVVEGMLILVGGVLLCTPGVLTDLTGFALLVPVTRRPLSKWLAAVVQARVVASAGGAPRASPFTEAPAGQAASRAPRVAHATVVETIGVESTEDKVSGE